jgi:two-component system cell cycle sensor histidine kinase/response regulator CckA
MEKQKISINRIVLVYMSIVGLVSTVAIGTLWVSSEISLFKKESRNLRSAYMENQQALLKKEVDRAIGFINHMRSKTENRLRRSVKNRVYEAYSIAENMYRQGKDSKSIDEIKARILDALRPIRFNNGRGYYFSFTLDGIETLFPVRPELEGTNMLPMKGGQGESVVADMIALVAEKGEGFYRYTWPKPDRRGFFPKIAFVKLFEPLGWVIGTGEYLDDVELDIQEECLDWISSIKFGKDGYVFAGQWDGMSLSGPAAGRNMYEVTDANGVKIVQELIEAAKQGGGFVHYVLPRFEGKKHAPKISYAVGVPEWKWYIGSGVYVDDIESDIESLKSDLHQRIRTNIRNIIAVLIPVLIAVVILINFLSHRLRENLSLFVTFFTKASTEATKIKRDDLYFTEFDQLAMAANEMVDERKRAETALQESEQKYRALFQLSSEGILLIKDTIVECNEAALKILRCEKSDIVGKTPEDFSPPALSRGSEFAIAQNERWTAAYDGVPQFFNWQCHRKDGSIAELEVSIKAITINDERFLLVTGRDVSEIKQAHKQREESDQRLNVIIENAPDAFFVHNLEGRIIQINEAACKNLGYSRDELIGMSVTDIEQSISKEEATKTWEKIASGSAAAFEGVHKRKNGSTIPVEVTIASVRHDDQALLFGFARDISDRKQMEKERQRYQSQINQAQKMEAIGTLAGGIAHDFNNLLMNIQGRASLMLYDLEKTHPVIEHANAIVDATQSAAQLTRQLLGVAQGGKYEVKPIDINDVVMESANMFGRTKKEVRIHTRLHEPSPVVAADRRQIEQVLLNMYINAWQAMPNGGELYLATAVVDLDAAFCKPHSVTSGKYANISVTDTGMGMDKPTLERIFDPFFTTKQKSRGTGLGLASAYGIVKNHDGIITVISQVDQGTTFNIYLPVSEESVAIEKTIESEGVEQGSGTILLVDDEVMVVDVGKAMLEKLGYRVIVANGGHEAVDIVGRQGDSIDLVLLDMIMPGMGGSETFDRIREIYPDLPVILSSGYSIDEQATQILNRGCNGFIQKPYTIPTLASKIKQILKSRD